MTSTARLLGEEIGILHLTAAYRADGLGRQILAQSRLLAAEGVRATVVGFRVGGDRSPLLLEAAAQGLLWEELRASNPFDLRQIGRLIGIARRAKARAIVTHGYKADLLGLLTARVGGMRAVAYAHGWTGQDSRVQRYERLDRTALRHMNAVVAVSESTRRTLTGLGVSASRIATIPNAISVSDDFPDQTTARRRLAESFDLPLSALLVGTAGRLSPEKAQDDFLRACAQLAPGIPEARFLLFGEGPERAALEVLSEQLGLRERTVFCGYRTDLPELLPGLDLFVLSSHREQLPFVILEAFAAGVPVVATEVGGVPELAEHEVTALLAPAKAPERLGAALETALRDQVATRRRATAAHALARDQYGSAANAQRFATLLRHVVAPSRRELAR